jgi:general secretion pathway protein N
LLVGAIVLLFAAALLLWFLPARWAVDAMASRMHGLRMDDVSGSVWHGHAERVAIADGPPLGALDWTLGRGALLGRTHVTANLHGPLGTFTSRFDQLQADHSEWRDIDFRFQAIAFASHPALRPFAPRGVLEGKLPLVSLQGNWPMSIEGNIDWLDASVQTAEGRVSLGDLHLRLAGTGGVLRAELKDSGTGPLDVRGALDATPLGWRIDVRMRPRTVDTAMAHLLARFGPAAADGSTTIRKQTGLVPTEAP